MKTFCTLPWINISVDPDGSVKPCCVSTDYITKEDGTKFNLGYDKLDEIYNSKAFVTIREKMLQGMIVEGCSRCYEQEKTSNISHRLSYQNFIVENKTTVLEKIKIKYFDLRFGNLCNLSCRSCNPTASSQIAKEINNINNADLKKFWYVANSQTLNDWYLTDTFNNNLLEQVENIQLLYLTGGEPTLNENNKKFLKYLIDIGKSKQVVVKFNTNLTNLNTEFFSLLNNFSNVIFFGSIDGYKEIQEYLRYPSNWEKIDGNIKQVIKNDTFKLIVTPVIQIGNLNKIIDLFDYIENINYELKKPIVNIDPIMLTLPEYLNIKYLPTDYKIKCWTRIENWISSKCKFQNTQFKHKLYSLKKICLTSEYNENQLKNYLKFNNILDNNRQHFLKDSNLELYTLLNSL